ncbi:RNA chaperone Hfq [Agathobaculum sp. NTUH-O15-33]|uniref:RNA chaperone Hfq n=1 Tax=Agathobaculum sp. NTUH-O15-33 TaxID=3079302 RepID=UPI002958336B|nr:RNA chaperone Hfq [Agathobaculum sp. NTUH-O15-33]WNX85217.1 RNA chaperone Hfq [Agathobaculum sp. NTUH-O15-33]
MDSKTPVNLQDKLLNAVRKDHTPVTIFLTNGFQIKCTVTGFDSNVIMVLAGGAQEMIYKHAISTIVPQTPVDISVQ